MLPELVWCLWLIPQCPVATQMSSKEVHPQQAVFWIADESVHWGIVVDSTSNKKHHWYNIGVENSWGKGHRCREWCSYELLPKSNTMSHFQTWKAAMYAQIQHILCKIKFCPSRRCLQHLLPSVMGLFSPMGHLTVSTSRNPIFGNYLFCSANQRPPFFYCHCIDCMHTEDILYYLYHYISTWKHKGMHITTVTGLTTL